MGLFLKQTEQRTQLQSKVAADLADRLNKRPIDNQPDAPPAMLDNQKTTSPLVWVWLLLAVVTVVGFVVFVLRS